MKRTLELSPQPGEMLKPKELLEIRGTGPLTLQDRRVFNTLVRHAWGPDLAKPGQWFEIPTGELRDDTDRNKRLQDTIERLMQTIVVVVENGEDGEPLWEHRTPLLSSNSLVVGPNRGVFRYRFTEELVNQLKDSTIFAKLDLEVMRSFRSKYAFSLYEAIARRIRMRTFVEELSVDDLRDLLGVEVGKLTNYRNLNLRAIQPAVEEVNALSPFEVSIIPKKKGKKVVSFMMGWNAKSEDALREAYAEMQRHSTGRKARTEATVEDTVTDERYETPEGEE
jgi:plasmid replication initiation protein